MDAAQTPRPRQADSRLEPNLSNWAKVVFHVVDGKYAVKIARQILFVISAVSAGMGIWKLSSSKLDLKKFSIPSGIIKLLGGEVSITKNNLGLRKEVEELLAKQLKLHPDLPLYVAIAREGDELDQIAYESDRSPLFLRKLNSHITDDKSIAAGITPIVIPARRWVTITTTGSLASIAHENHVSLQLLLEANYLKIDHANVGSKIVVPYQHGRRYSENPESGL